MDWNALWVAFVRQLPDLPMYAAPVALAALGETVAQRSGVLNIGLEGMMLAGAFFGMLACLLTGSPWVGVGVGVTVGLLAGVLSAVFCVVLSADQVVVGTAINLLSLGLTGTLFRLRFGDSGQLLSVPKLPQAGGVDAVIVFLVVATVVVGWLLKRTHWGLVLRATGEYPDAAEAAGFSVVKMRTGAMAIGGAFAGLAGAYLALGITGSFAENMTAGRGFVAIAMVTFGRWRPAYVLAASVLIGLAESLQFLFQAAGTTVPFQLMLAMPYLAALAVLVFVGKGTVSPGALGLPYRRER